MYFFVYHWKHALREWLVRFLLVALYITPPPRHHPTESVARRGVGLLLTSALLNNEGVNDPGFSLLCYWVNYTSPHSRVPDVNWIKVPGTHMVRRKLILFVGKKMYECLYTGRVYCIIIKNKNFYFLAPLYTCIYIQTVHV